MLAKKKGESFMKKKISEIPKFKSLKEEAEFWDNHEFTEFEGELEDVRVVFDLKKPKEETLILRLQKGVKERLEKIAASKGLNVSTLARTWLIEKLQLSG